MSLALSNPSLKCHYEYIFGRLRKSTGETYYSGQEELLISCPEPFPLPPSSRMARQHRSGRDRVSAKGPPNPVPGLSQSRNPVIRGAGARPPLWQRIAVVSRKVAGLGGKGSLGSNSILESGDLEGKVIYPTLSAHMQHTYMSTQNTKHTSTHGYLHNHTICASLIAIHITHTCAQTTYTPHIFTCYTCHTDHKQHTRAHHNTHHTD